MAAGFIQQPEIRDQAQLRQQLDRQQRQTRALAEEDLIIEFPRRLLLRSPNGHYWAISVSDTGAITATDVGDKPQ